MRDRLDSLLTFCVVLVLLLRLVVVLRTQGGVVVSTLGNLELACSALLYSTLLQIRNFNPNSNHHQPSLLSPHPRILENHSFTNTTHSQHTPSHPQFCPFQPTPKHNTIIGIATRHSAQPHLTCSLHHGAPTTTTTSSGRCPGPNWPSPSYRAS